MIRTELEERRRKDLTVHLKTSYFEISHVDKPTLLTDSLTFLIAGLMTKLYVVLGISFNFDMLGKPCELSKQMSPSQCKACYLYSQFSKFDPLRQKAQSC